MITFLVVILGIVANASASVLIKYAMLPERHISLHDPLSIILNLPLWIGLSLYGTAFVLYAISLQRLPLNVAHPVLTCGAIALVAIFSILLFNESLSPIKFFGIGFVIAGVIMISWKTI